MLPNLGIIAGSGDLPREIARLYTSRGGQCFIAALEGEFIADDIGHVKFPIGAAGAILDYFNKSEVKNIIIIGGINRPNLRAIKVDLEGAALIAKIFRKKILGDDNVLRLISEYLEDKGFCVISPREVLLLNDYNNLITSRKSPSKQNIIDINIGKQVLASLGNVDVGQSVIVCNGYVLGIEAAEGTDNLIIRCKLLRRMSGGGVLVKMKKKGQDDRLDIPVIGPKTINLLAENNFDGLAIEKDGVIIINPSETNESLRENSLFLQLI